MDQYPRGHTRGGSHGDSRIFRLAYAEPDYARLALESLAGWRQLEEECGQAVLATTGGVDHGPGVVDAIGGVLGRLGLPFEVLGAEAAMARWPGMRFEGDVVYQPDAGRLHADRAVAAQYPSASIIGNDLSPIQPSFVPSNVSHEKLNEKQLARENPGFWSFIDKSAPGPIRNR